MDNGLNDKLNQIKPIRTMYDASLGEIARKNFVAGFSHALGGFAMTLLTWGVIYLIILKLILPLLLPMLSTMQDLIKVLPQNHATTTTTTGASLQLPENVLQQLQQLQGK